MLINTLFNLVLTSLWLTAFRSECAGAEILKETICHICVTRFYLCPSLSRNAICIFNWRQTIIWDSCKCCAMIGWSLFCDLNVKQFSFSQSPQMSASLLHSLYNSIDGANKAALTCDRTGLLFIPHILILLSFIGTNNGNISRIRKCTNTD